MTKYNLGDIVKIKYGKDHKQLNDGNIPVYGTGGIMRYADTELYSKKSVLIPRKGSLGNLFLVTEPFWTVDTLFYTEINESIVIPEFLFYKLKTYDLASLNVGSAVPSLTTAILNALEVEIPSLEMQSKIIDVLQAFDFKIENNKKINHHLEQIGTTIWQEKFSDKIPNGTLGDIAIISSGKRPPVKTTVPTDEEKIPILGASSIMGYTNQALYHQKILVTGRVGTHGIIQRYQRSCWPSDNTLVLQSNSYEFVYQILKNIDFTVMNRGSTQPLITQTDLKKSNIYIPTTNELSDFEIIVGTLMKQHEQNNIENDILSTLRDTLLPKLLFGEISVNQAAK